MSNRVNKSFYEYYCKDDFDIFISNIEYELEINNNDYLTLIKDRKKILEKYPMVRKVIENDECDTLNSKEIVALQNYISLMDNCHLILQKEIFLRGMRELYYILIKLKIIK